MNGRDDGDHAATSPTYNSPTLTRPSGKHCRSQQTDRRWGARRVAGHHLLMTNETYEVRRAALDESDVRRLGKWASLWADLIHADMALSERAGLPEIPVNVFVRRALWESAIVSYGRMATSDKRNVDYDELVQSAEVTVALSCTRSSWSGANDHVAHRKSRDLKTVNIYADYLESDPDALDSIRVQVTSSGGPPAGSHFAVEFAEHVKALQDSVWANFLAPIAELIARRRPRSFTVSVEPSETHSLVIEQILWSRTNGTGIADVKRDSFRDKTTPA